MMQFLSMNTLLPKRNRRIVRRKAMPPWPGGHVVREACDEFIELRRERGTGGKSRLIGGRATIGRHSVLLLIHCQGRGRDKPRTLESAQLSAYDFRKSQHLIQLARKFKLPVLVCVVDPPTTSVMAPTGWRETLELPGHLRAQWLLDVPILLAVLTKKSSCRLFGTWLADQSVVLEQSQFVVAMGEQQGHQRYQVDARTLARGRIIDRTISGFPNLAGLARTATAYRLKKALIQMLDEVTRLSPKALGGHRKDKLARVGAMVANLCGRGK